MLKPKNVIDREDKGEIVEAEGGGTMTKVYCTAIVLAAGSGKRMGTKVHKQYLQLCEKPVLAYSLQAFQQSDLIDEIILVVGKGELWRNMAFLKYRKSYAEANRDIIRFGTV